MKNRARTRFTFILSLILASSALFSCGGETKEASGTTASDTTSDAVTSELSIEDQRKLIDDELPEMDFGGDTFNITVNTFCQDGFISEELNGDVLSDAIYHRNKTVEDDSREAQLYHWVLRRPRERRAGVRYRRGRRIPAADPARDDG